MTDKPRYISCVGCGELWNVSIKAYIPPSGYLCPRCRAKPAAMRRIKHERT